MGKRIRLIQVAVQPKFALDDGETLEEIEHSVVVIPAAEWPTYSSERFPREVAAWQKQIDAEAETQVQEQAQARGQPKSNRAARRGKGGNP
jgi:hypothetical protein